MRLLQVILLHVCCAAAVYSQAVPLHGKPAGGVTARPELRLTTNIVGQKYCSSTLLRLSLRLTFTNAGEEPIILYKDSSLISRYMVSKNFETAAAKKYELSVAPMYGLLKLGLHPEPPADDSLFITLKAGETYEVGNVLSIPLVEGGEGSLRPGNHVLQIKVWTWYHPPASASKVRELWRDKGYLWSDAAISLPMLFTVAKDRAVADCTQPT
jgi:hypothetical protein